MRAPFDTTATLYRGPGTATPYEVRAILVPCRWVDDDYFVNTAAPLSASVSYATMQAIEPNGPGTVDAGGGSWTYNFALADRLEFASDPGVLYIAAEVLSCTWPSQAPYWRTELIRTTETPLTPCQAGYSETYAVEVVGIPGVRTVSRVSPTLWSGSGLLLLAEASGAPGPGCVSDWQLLGGGFWQASWQGGPSFQTFTNIVPGGPTAFVYGV